MDGQWRGLQGLWMVTMFWFDCYRLNDLFGAQCDSYSTCSMSRVWKYWGWCNSPCTGFGIITVRASIYRECNRSTNMIFLMPIWEILNHLECAMPRVIMHCKININTWMDMNEWINEWMIDWIIKPQHSSPRLSYLLFFRVLSASSSSSSLTLHKCLFLCGLCCI